jgi:hypothetical protein
VGAPAAGGMTLVLGPTADARLIACGQQKEASSPGMRDQSCSPAAPCRGARDFRGEAALAAGWDDRSVEVGAFLDSVDETCDGGSFAGRHAFDSG